MPEKKHFLDNSTEYFHTLHLVFYLMVSVPLILFCVVYLRRMEAGGLDSSFRFGSSHLLTTGAVVVAGVMAYYRYRQRFRHYDAAATFRHRLRFFHRAAWLKYLWLGTANLLPVVGLYLQGDQYFVGLYAITLILFSLNRPTARRVSDDLLLDETERRRLTSNQDFSPDEP